jgi:hypothetical protein
VASASSSRRFLSFSFSLQNTIKDFFSLSLNGILKQEFDNFKINMFLNKRGIHQCCGSETIFFRIRDPIFRRVLDPDPDPT